MVDALQLVADQAYHSEHGGEWSQSFVSLGGVRLLLAVLERQLLCLSRGRKAMIDYDVAIHNLGEGGREGGRGFQTPSISTPPRFRPRDYLFHGDKCVSPSRLVSASLRCEMPESSGLGIGGGN